jgi:hypothetical protein
MVKRRHNTISPISEIVTFADRKRQEKVRSKHRLQRIFPCVIWLAGPVLVSVGLKLANKPFTRTVHVKLVGFEYA